MFFNCRQCYKVFQVGEGEAPKASYKQQTTFTVNRQRAYQRVSWTALALRLVLTFSSRFAS
jgi:hypothetical protein